LTVVLLIYIKYHEQGELNINDVVHEIFKVVIRESSSLERPTPTAAARLLARLAATRRPAIGQVFGFVDENRNGNEQDGGSGFEDKAGQETTQANLL
jgi:hypothetical protein